MRSVLTEKIGNARLEGVTENREAFGMDYRANGGFHIGPWSEQQPVLRRRRNAGIFGVCKGV